MDTITITGFIKKHNGSLWVNKVVISEATAERFFSDADMVSTGEIEWPINNTTGAISITLAVPSDSSLGVPHTFTMPDGETFTATVSAGSSTDWKTFVETATDDGTYEIIGVAHATTHSDGGADEITVENLATSAADDSLYKADSGGVVEVTIAALKTLLGLAGLAYKAVIQAGDVDTEASTDGQILTSDGAGNAAWEDAAGGGGGIGGATGATDNAVLRTDGTGGATLQNSAVTIDDSGEIIAPQGASAGFMLGDGDTGFYEVAANTMVIRVSGSDRWIFTGEWLTSNLSTGGGLLSAAASATVPTLLPKRGVDTNTGIGSAGADQLSLIAGGAEGARVDTDSTAGNTRFLLYDVDNATLARVSVGADDSGGAGYKVLRIPN